MMNLQENIKRILREETTIPTKERRRFLQNLIHYYDYEIKTIKNYVHRYENKQKFIKSFINNLFETFYEGWLSNDIERFTDEFDVMKNYVERYVLDNHIKDLEDLWHKRHTNR